MKPGRALSLATLLILTLGACGAPGSGFENPFTTPLTVTFTPATVNLEQGKSTHVAVNITTQANKSLSATLSAQTSSGINVTPDASGLTINVAMDTPVGTYGIPVTAKAGTGSGQALLTVTVTAPNSISTNP